MNYIKKDPGEDEPAVGSSSGSWQPAQSSYSPAVQDDLINSTQRRGRHPKRLPKDKTCMVCGDRALGYNFNAITCESCKAFFRRNAFRNIWGRCGGTCNIDMESRSYCKKCRLKKCFSVGMKRDLILNERQKEERRLKIQENRVHRLGMGGLPLEYGAGEVSDGSSQEATMTSPEGQTEVKLPLGLDLTAARDIAKVSDTSSGSTSSMMCEEKSEVAMATSSTGTPGIAGISPGQIAQMRMGGVTTQMAGIDLSKMFGKDLSQLAGVDLAKLAAGDLSKIGGALPPEAMKAMSAMKGGALSPDAMKAMSAMKGGGLAGLMGSFGSLFGAGSEGSSPNSHVIAGNVDPTRYLPMSESNQKKLLEVIHAFQKSFDCPITKKIVNSPTNTDFLNMADASVRRLVKMAKQLQCFRMLKSEDQVVLLKGSVLEVLVLRSVKLFDPKTMNWNIPGGSGVLQRITAEHMQSTNSKSITFMHQYIQFARGVMSATRRDNVILMMIMILTIFSPDRDGLINKSIIHSIQEDYAAVLQEFIQVNHPRDRVMFARVIQKLADIRDLQEVHTSMLQNAQLSDLEPLIVEIFDLSS